jgi:hypothetical protein
MSKHVDRVINAKEELGNLLLEREVMYEMGKLYSKEGAQVMAAMSKVSLELASETSEMVEEFDAEVKKMGGTATGSWKHTAAGYSGEHYPLTMKTYARVLGTLAQHHDNHLTQQHQITTLEKRIAALEGSN